MLHVVQLTPLQREAHERHKQWQAGIRAKAEALQASKRLCESRAAVEGALTEQLLLRKRWEELAADPAKLFPGHPKVWRKQPGLLRITVEDILQVVAMQLNVRCVDLLSSTRKAPVVRARQIAMYLAAKLTPHSFPELGRQFGGKNHTTVMHAVRSVGWYTGDPAAKRPYYCLESEEREIDPTLAEDVVLLKRQLEEPPAP